MLNIFRDLRNRYLLSSIGGGAVIALVMAFTRFSDIFVFIVVLVWALLMGWIFTRKAGSRVKYLNEIRENCNVREYISRYSEILSKVKAGSPGDHMIRLNLAAGFLDINDVTSAVNLMRSVDVKPGTKSSKPIAAVYHNNYSLIFLKEGDYESAEQALRSCRDVIKNGVPETEQARMEGMCRLREAQIYISKPDMDRMDIAQTSFENYMRGASTKLERSSAAYWLARLWKVKGDTEGEKHYLRIAAKDGGDTFYAEEARKILNSYEYAPEIVDNQGV